MEIKLKPVGCVVIYFCNSIRGFKNNMAFASVFFLMFYWGLLAAKICNE